LMMRCKIGNTDVMCQVKVLQQVELLLVPMVQLLPDARCGQISVLKAETVMCDGKQRCAASRGVQQARV